MKHILVFETAIRLGSYVTKYVGPFNSTDEAGEWYKEAVRTWAITPPNVTLETLLDPQS